jgi:flagellar protein FlaF
MAAAQAESDDFRSRIDVLDWNRRIWMTLAADCSLPTNPLDPQLRARIISLSMWVGRHSSAVMRGEETFEPLIEVNRIMMQGLGARAAA